MRVLFPITHPSTIQRCSTPTCSPVPPSYKDFGKAANDLLNKDYPLGVTTFEAKTRAPNGVLFKAGIAKDDARDVILGWAELYSL